MPDAITGFLAARRHLGRAQPSLMHNVFDTKQMAKTSGMRNKFRHAALGGTTRSSWRICPQMNNTKWHMNSHRLHQWQPCTHSNTDANGDSLGARFQKQRNCLMREQFVPTSPQSSSSAAGVRHKGHWVARCIHRARQGTWKKWPQRSSVRSSPCW